MERLKFSDELSNRLLIAVVSALALHHLIFRRGEWHLQAPTLLTIWLLSPFAAFLLELRLDTNDVVDAVYRSLLTTTCFTVTIFLSIAVFRFTQLRSFPGPRLARLSKLWHVVKSRNGKNHLVLDALREEYGDFVRTGEFPSPPSESCQLDILRAE
jgi:tryprostatin B 6-hydroxylase